MSVFICGCCNEVGSNLSKHTHHKKPVSLGGTNSAENLIDLCPNCHDALHNAAYKLINPKHSVSKIRDQILIIYKDNFKAAQSCWELALLVRDAMLKSADEGCDPNSLVSISTIVRMEHKMLLARVAKECGVSQEELVRTVLLNGLSKRSKVPINAAVECRIIRRIKRSKKRSY